MGAVFHSSGLVLRVRYRGATNSRGARLVVSDTDRGRWVAVPYAYGSSNDERRSDAVAAWCVRHLPEYAANSWVIGTVSGSEWVAVSVGGLL